MRPASLVETLSGVAAFAPARDAWLRHLPPWARLLIDCGAVVVAVIAAFYIRFEAAVPDEELAKLLDGLPLVLSAYLAAFGLTAPYRSVWRYTGVEDVLVVVKAGAMGGLLTVLVAFVAELGYPRSVLVLIPLGTVLLMTAVRVACRVVARGGVLTRRDMRRRVVIIGAGDTGEAIARAMLGSGRGGYHLAGFLDDDPGKSRTMIHGVPVLGPISRLSRVIAAHSIEEAIIAIPHLPLPRQREIWAICARSGVGFKTLPSVAELVRGEGKLSEVKHGGREPTPAPCTTARERRIAETMAGSCVMVTGAGGRIGAEICRQLLRYGPRALVMVDRAENALHEITTELDGFAGATAVTPLLADVRHVQRMVNVLRRHRPDIVIHAAAFGHRPLMDRHPAEAFLNNVIGTQRLADLVREQGVGRLIFISTEDAARSADTLSVTKRLSELYLLALNRLADGSDRAARPFRIIRFGSFVGAGHARRFARARTPGTVPPVTVVEAAGAVLDVCASELDADLLWPRVDEGGAVSDLLGVRQDGPVLAEIAAAIRELERQAVAGGGDEMLASMTALVVDAVADDGGLPARPAVRPRAG